MKNSEEKKGFFYNGRNLLGEVGMVAKKLLCTEHLCITALF